MMVFPSMLVGACKKAGIKVPEDVDNYDAENFPHFSVFCTLQLCRPMVSLDEHWNNAVIISKLSKKEIETFTLTDYLAKGLSFAT